MPKDVLHLEEYTWAEPSEGQLLVKVRASGVNLADQLIVRGYYPGISTPLVPGLEAAGEVVAVGPGSTFAVGDQVMGITTFAEGLGSFADYAYIREPTAARIPSTFSDEEAAGFVLGFRTAYTGLVERVPVEAGQVLAVLGAGGSSGSATVILGKALGATVIAVAGTDAKLEFCTKIGADHGVNYRTADVGAELKRLTDGKGVDVIFDLVGGETGTQALQGISERGRVAVVGYASGSFLTVDPLDVLLRNYAVVGVYAGGFTPEEEAAATRQLVDMAERSDIHPPISVEYSFDEVPEAIESLQSGSPAGKTIIRMS
jgi:NADPH:quinone reductase